MNDRTDELGIDFEKLRSVISHNWILILAIFLLCNAIAYSVIRWTKPLYESESVLRLDVKDDSNLLGLQNLQNESENILAGEIEIIKSKNFLSNVLESLDLSVTYLTAGDVLNDEKFLSSPIVASVKIKNPSALDVPVYVKILSEQRFQAVQGSKSDLDNSPEYGYDELVEFDNMSFRLYLTKYYNQDALNFVHIFIPRSDESLMDYMESNLTVEPAKQVAKTVRIAFRDNNPLKAQTLVNTIDTLYLRYTDRKKNLENEQKIKWLDDELAKIENQLAGYENYIEEFTIENRTSDLNEDLKRVLEVMNSLDSQRYELNSRIRQLERLKNDVEGGGAEEILMITTVQIPDYLQEDLAQLKEFKERRDRLRLSYRESTAAIQQLNESISLASATVLTQLDNLKTQLENDLAEVNATKARLESDFATLPGKSNEFNKNKRFYELYEEFYLSLLQSKAQFEIARAGTSNDFVILSSATYPSSPISPNKLIIHGIGLVAGSVFGLFLIGILYLLNNKVNNLKEIENSIDASILGSIPKITSATGSKLIVDKNPKSSLSESLRSVRTNIQFMIGEASSPMISITSTVSGEGKTFLAVNLGAIMAMTNKRVVILDLDMRRPRVHAAFDEENSEKGISTILINKYGISDSIRSTRLDNLFYIPSGPVPPNPSELLLTAGFDELIEELRASFDLIILDTPPIGVVTDAKIILQKSDLAIYVVRANYSHRSFLKEISALYENQTTNLGVVLNSANRSGTEKYGYGYYENRKKTPVHV